MEALIPAAGYATRLYPLTRNKPKALLEVQGRPVLDYVVDRVLELPGLRRVTLISNARFLDAFLAWRDGFQAPVKIDILNDGSTSEHDRLGAIGDKHFAIQQQKIRDDLVDVSADNLFSFSLHGIHAFFREKKAPVIGLHDVGDLDAAKRFGVVMKDETRKVVAFEEKPHAPKSTLVSTGIYFYPRKTVPLFARYIREGGKPDQPGYFLEWLHQRTAVYGYRFTGQWFDIGSFEMLERARKTFRQERASAAAATGTETKKHAAGSRGHRKPFPEEEA